MTEQIKPILVLEFGEKGGRLEFEQPADVQQWYSEEIGKWQWLQQIQQASNVFNMLRNEQQRANQFIAQWIQNQSNDANSQALMNLKNIIEPVVRNQLVGLSSSPVGAFILRLQQERGPQVAAGAFFALGGPFAPNNVPLYPLIIEGMIKGFLYANEIDWTATTHRQALEKLKHQYTGNISEQKRKLQELELTNQDLNVKFGEMLETKNLALDNLHENQEVEFKQLIGAHENNLKAIEEAYDQKLALLKPVKYWNARKKLCVKNANRYAIASIIVGIVILVALGILAYKFFFSVPVGEKPQIWQVGVFSVVSFFCIWLERILVRLFISNMHLATDAEERVTMLQTYLSIIREGSEFSPEDKSLILERLFDPASDGLVKDDAAPPTPLEMLSRR